MRHARFINASNKKARHAVAQMHPEDFQVQGTRHSNVDSLDVECIAYVVGYRVSAISTRRLLARPSAVTFDATGSALPRPVIDHEPTLSPSVFK